MKFRVEIMYEQEAEDGYDFKTQKEAEAFQKGWRVAAEAGRLDEYWLRMIELNREDER